MTASMPPTGIEPNADLPPPRELNEDELAANVIISIHRITKGATIYASDNQAAIRHLEGARRALQEYGHKTEVNPKIFFTEKSIFVGGRLLRAGRNVYQAALELGTILRKFGIDEVAIGYDVGLEDLRRFQTAVRECLQEGGESPAKVDYERIRLRRGQAPGRRDEEIAPEELIVRTYATATIVMRRFLQAVQRGDYRLPIGVRRIAQQLAELSAAQSPAFLGTTAVYNAKHEHAGRAVNAALVSLAMARQLIEDKRILARIAMASLMFDVGIPRVAGTDADDLRAGRILPPIIEDQHEELPFSAAATMWAIGGFGDAAIQNAVLVYEATSVAYREHAEPAYAGLRETTLAARIVAASRRFNDLLANPKRPRTADQALCQLLVEAETDVGRTLVRVLASALGLFTTGSLVHLSTGDVAKVVKTSDNPLLFSMPVVSLVMGGGGHGSTIDLAKEEGEDGVRITALVELGDEAVVDEGDMGSRRGRATPDDDAYDDDAYDDDEYDDDEYDDDSEVDYGEAELSEEEEAALGIGDRESWSDLQLTDDSIPPIDESLPPLPLPEDDAPPEPERRRSAPPAAPADDLALDEDFAPAPVTDHEIKRPFKSRVASARRPKPIVSVMRAPKGKRDSSVPPAAEPAPAANVDAALMAYLSEMGDDEGSKQPNTPPPREVLPPLTPPPLTPMPDVVPRTADKAEPTPTPPPATPLPVSGRKLAELKPTATGTLEKTPLVHLLVYALDRGLSGTTAIVEPEGDAHLIYFERGVASKVRTAGTVHPLDKVLRDLGAVPQKQLKRSMLEIEQTGELHGEYLIAQGLIDDEVLVAALQWQLFRKVSHMLSLPGECRYAYYDGVNALADYGGPELTPIDPLALVMAGLRLMGRSPLVSQSLSKLGTQPLKIRASAQLDRLRLHADELAVVDAIRNAPTSLTDIVSSRPGDERTTLLTIYALMITRSLDIGLMQKPPLAVDVAPIEDRWLAMSPMSDPRAGAVVSSAPPPSTAPFGTMRSGRAAPPSDPDPPSAADEAATPDIDTSSEVIDATDSEPIADPISESHYDDPFRMFKKAQLKRMTGKLDEAEDLMQMAVDAAPEEPEYIATLAWIQAEILGPPEDLEEGESTDHYDAQIELIDRALTLDAGYAKALFYRAELLRLSGHRTRALEDYRRVAELDPHNEEAAEQVALLEG